MGGKILSMTDEVYNFPIHKKFNYLSIEVGCEGGKLMIPHIMAYLAACRLICFLFRGRWPQIKDFHKTKNSLKRNFISSTTLFRIFFVIFLKFFKRFFFFCLCNHEFFSIFPFSLHQKMSNFFAKTKIFFFVQKIH